MLYYIHVLYCKLKPNKCIFVLYICQVTLWWGGVFSLVFCTVSCSSVTALGREREIYMRKYKQRPEDETSLPEEPGSWWKFFSLLSVCFSASLFLLHSLEVFYEAAVQGQGTGSRALWRHNDNKPNLSLCCSDCWTHAAEMTSLFQQSIKHSFT